MGVYFDVTEICLICTDRAIAYDLTARKKKAYVRAGHARAWLDKEGDGEVKQTRVGEDDHWLVTCDGVFVCRGR